MSAKRPLIDTVPTWLFVLLAVALTVGSGGRWPIAVLAWVAPIPWLLWMRRTSGWLPRLVILPVAVAAACLQLATIITAPIPWPFALLFGVPAGITLWLVLLAADQLRRRTSERHGVYGFAALVALSEWVSSAASPLGVWGTASSSQVDNLVLLQLASLVGVVGIGFVMAWVAGFVAAVLADPGPRRWLADGVVLAAVLSAVAIFGTARLAAPSTSQTVPVAAVVTDVGFGPQGLPSAQELASNVDTLFERTALAAERGARLVVWNEGATAVAPHEESALLARGRQAAVDHGIDLVLAYIVVTNTEPLAFRNRAVFIDAEGDVLTTYHKRHPVPGETEPSDNPVPRLERPYGVVSLAICYDEDFPEMSRAHAAVGAQIVAVPSSDWAGIDPVHTLMARIRAIEGGSSLLRSTRWAASAGFDPMGRVRGWMRADEANDRVLLVDLPVDRVPTLYALIGDAPVALALLYLLVLTGLVVRRGTWAPRDEL